MWARVENAAVVEITDIDPAGRYHPDLQWKPCGDEVCVGWVCIGEGFEEPVEPLPTREEVEAARLRAYADPINGSDRHFSESSRMKAMSEDGWEGVFETGVQRYTEIREELPWPEGV